MFVYFGHRFVSIIERFTFLIGPTIYSSAPPNSARPALELRYSFLSISLALWPSNEQYLSIKKKKKKKKTIPLNSPVENVVAGNGGRSPVEDLAAETSPGVEDGVVESTGEGVLAVRGNTVGDDALLMKTTYRRDSRSEKVSTW